MLTIWAVGWLGCKEGASPDLVFTNANNYGYSGVLGIDTVEIQPQSDATIDWSAVTTDVRGYAITPADVNQIAVLGNTDDYGTTIDLIERNELDTAQEAYLYDSVDQTSVTMSQFDSVAVLEPAILVDDPGITWIVSLLRVEDGINELLMAQIFVPTTGSTQTVVPLTDDSATFTAEADFHSAPPIVTAADIGPYTLEWTEATTDVYGHEFEATRGDQLMVARFDSEDLAEIEAGFLQLDTNAAELYTAGVHGLTGTDLDLTLDADGNPFPGFTTDGTWLVAVICTTCINPVPLLLSIVDVK